MTYDDLNELHNINLVSNLESIFRLGILSHDRASKITHRSVAMAEMQDKREKKFIPNTKRRLHSYANLYFNARNKMMSKRRGNHKELCVIRVNKSILQHPDAVVADQNASSDYVRFGDAGALRLIDTDTVFARSWLHPGDKIAEWRHGSAMCAEVLIPDVVPPEYIKGIYVSCEETATAVKETHRELAVEVNADLFFQAGW